MFSFFGAGFLFLFLLLAFHVVAFPQTKTPSITMLDVPGESIFLPFPEGHHVVIDGGENGVAAEKIGKMLPFWNRRIDAVILTHPDNDHISGLFSVFSHYPVENLFLTGSFPENAPEKIVLIKNAKNNGTRLSFLQEETDFSFGKTTFDVLSPKKSLAGLEKNNQNNISIVVRMTHKNITALFMGDAEKAEEKEILLSPSSVTSTVLKVGHHGSKTSTSDVFLRAVSPDIAIISAEKNNIYQFPQETTLKSLQENGVQYFITKNAGDIHLPLSASLFPSLSSAL